MTDVMRAFMFVPLSVNIRMCAELTSCLSSYHLKDRGGTGVICAMSYRSRSLLGPRGLGLTTPVLQSHTARRRNIFSPDSRSAASHLLKDRHLLNHPVDTSLART